MFRWPNKKKQRYYSVPNIQEPKKNLTTYHQDQPNNHPPIFRFFVAFMLIFQGVNPPPTTLQSPKIPCLVIALEPPHTVASPPMKNTLPTLGSGGAKKGLKKPALFPSKIEWDQIPTDPVQEVANELLDSQVFSGSVKRGSCWRFLGLLESQWLST